MVQKNSIFSVKNASDSTGFLLWQVTNLWQRKIKKALEEYDLTHSQFVLMANIHWLDLQKIEVTQIVLSLHTKIDPMTTSTVLRTLEKKGFVKRKEHNVDTRAKTIQLSEDGTKIIESAVRSVEEFDNDFFGVLANREQFNNELLKLIE